MIPQIIIPNRDEGSWDVSSRSVPDKFYTVDFDYRENCFRCDCKWASIHPNGPWCDHIRRLIKKLIVERNIH